MAPAWTLKLLLLPLLLLSALSCLLCPLQPTRYPLQSMLGLPSGAARSAAWAALREAKLQRAGCAAASCVWCSELASSLGRVISPAAAEQEEGGD